MSTIDERIVSMKFDNKQFESGVSSSLNSINNLKRGLDFSGSAKGLDSISESAKRVSFDGMSSGVEAVKVKFSALQVTAITALTNITNSAVNAGKQLISSLTIDPITDGFKEYETQMNSVQTILANTSSKGSTLEDVKSALSELNTYSDKTIYNFTEMSRNIGTFTAAGVDLKTSTAAIKGIANLAAVSGSNSTQASTAMYQLSQALASGRVSLEDWNSVVNAGMGGAVFQNALMNTAKAMGKNVDASKSFRESISSKDGTGWLTSDVLLETLKQFTGDMSEAELKAKGFTDEQIKDIMKMGVTANDAATKVKTFTQLMDTLKEAVGSGWAQTWQLIFGDFDEAKDLFTSVSNTLGGMISSSSQARNDMLSGWKDLGGRTVLIDAIKNSFEGVMGVVQAVSGAFREIFPQTTSQQLYNFTEGLKNLTENLKLSDGTLYNLKSTFKGVFAIFDIGKTALLAVGNAIGIILGGAGNLASSILGVTGSFGEWLTALDRTIKQSDVLNKVLSTIAYGIKNGLSGITYVFDMIVKGLASVSNAIGQKFNFSGFDSLKSTLEFIGNRMSGIGNDANSMAVVVGGAFVAMGKSIANSNIGELFITLYDTVKMVGSAIGTAVGKIVDAISNAIRNADFSGMMDAIAAMSIGGMLLAFKKFMQSLTDTVENSTGFLDNIKGMVSNVSDILDGVRGSLESYQQNLKAGTLIKIGIAISLLAASIVAISLIDSDKLVSSLAAIGTLFAQLLIAMKLYTMIGDFKSGVVKASIVMIAMSTSILILSDAMKNISSLDWEGVFKGAAGIALLAKILVNSAQTLSSGSKIMIKGATQMILFAAAIKILAGVCIELSTIDWNGLAKGLVGVGVLMTEISLFLNNSKFSAKSITTATGILILAGALKVLVSAVQDFGSMDWGSIVKGLKSIGILLTEMMLFTNLTGNAKNVISTSIALIAIGEAMKILASAVQAFGSMDWGTLSTGLKAMAIALTEIVIAVNLLPTNLPITAAGLVIVGAALNILASALNNMGGMTWDSIAKGLVALGGSLGILAIALNLMSGTFAGSSALLVAAGALAILAPALVLLGSMSWESIIKGLVDLAGTIAIFGLSSMVLAPLVPIVLALSAALVIFGVGIIGIGAGLSLVGVGLAGIATGFTLLSGATAAGATAVVAALGIIITGVTALIPEVMAKIGKGLVAFCKVFIDGIPAILEAVNTIIKSIVDCIVTNMPLIVNGVLQTLSSVLDAIIKWVPTIAQQVADIILALLKVISDNIGKFTTAAVDIIVGFIKGITDSLPKIIDSAFNLIITFINGLADGINNNAGAIGDACVKLVDAIVNGIGTLADKFIEAGKHAVEGFINGLISLPGKLWDAGKEIGNKALEAAKNALGIHSPSREFKKLGAYSGEGYIIGLKSYGDKVATTSANIGYGAIDSMSNAIAGISDVVSSNIDSQPVISPVMDLSNIQNGSNQLYSMMSSLDNYSLDSSINFANSKAKSISSRQLLTDLVESDNNNSNTRVTNSQAVSKQPMTLQLVLQNGKAIAEYIVDDIDSLMGNRNIITGRMVGA